MLKRLLVVLFVAATAAASHADTLSTFSLHNVATPVYGPITGTVVIDTTTGVVESIDAFGKYYGINYEYNLNPFQSDARDLSPAGWVFDTNYVYIQAVASDTAFRIGMFLDTDSLVNYTGGGVCQGVGDCPGRGASGAAAYSGLGGPAGYSFIGLSGGGSLTFVSSTSTDPVPTDPAVAPEPSTLVMLGTGLVGMAGAVRRRLTA